MDATFDPALPTPIDWMRDALGDVDMEAPIAPDDTYIAQFEDANKNWRLAAAAMARSFSSRAISSPSSFTATGDMSVSWNDRASNWLKIAATLEAESSRIDAGKGGFWTAQVERSDLSYDASEYSIDLKRR